MEKRQWMWLLAIAAAVAASVYYHLLLMNRLEQTSALFIGIPALIAAICVLTPKPRTATGTAVKSVTLFLCIAGAFLGEGFICILMASPLFYLIAVLIGRARDRDTSRGHTLSCVIILAALPLSIEGVLPVLSLARQEAVTVERVIPASSQAVDRLFPLPRA